MKIIYIKILILINFVHHNIIASSSISPTCKKMFHFFTQHQATSKTVQTNTLTQQTDYSIEQTDSSTDYTYIPLIAENLERHNTQTNPSYLLKPRMGYTEFIYEKYYQNSQLFKELQEHE